MLKIPARPFFMASLLVLTSLLQGCTPTMWSQTPISLRNPLIRGVRTVTDVHGAEQSYLIVSYSHKKQFLDLARGVELDYYAIPLQNGCPPAKLTTSTVATSTPQEILKRLNKKTLKQVARYRFSWRNHQLGEHPPEASRFVDAIGTSTMLLTPMSIGNASDGCQDEQGYGVRLVAYQWDGRNFKLVGRDKPLGPESKILLLPDRQRRFFRAHKLAYTRSICLTPLTLTVDAGLVVVAAPMFLVGSAMDCLESVDHPKHNEKREEKKASLASPPYGCRGGLRLCANLSGKYGH